jgi:hypothetical protein
MSERSLSFFPKLRETQGKGETCIFPCYPNDNPELALCCFRDAYAGVGRSGKVVDVGKITKFSVESAPVKAADYII